MKTQVALLGALVASLSGLATAAEKPQPKGERLSLVLDVGLGYEPNNPKTLVISATGRVPTGGWTKAKLVPRKADKSPADGIYEFDFTVVRPEGIVTMAVERVIASFRWESPPEDLKGVRIYGVGKGVKTRKFGDAKAK